MKSALYRLVCGFSRLPGSASLSLGCLRGVLKRFLIALWSSRDELGWSVHCVILLHLEQKCADRSGSQSPRVDADLSPVFNAICRSGLEAHYDPLLDC